MDLIPTREVVRRLRRKQTTISRWVASGRLTPALRVPGKRGAMFFDAKQVDRLAKQLRDEEARRLAEFDEPEAAAS